MTNMFKMLFVGKPAKSAYLVFWRYANFQKTSWLRIIIISENFQCLIPNLRTCTIVIHTIFWKFLKLRLTSPSGPIRYSILKKEHLFAKDPSWLHANYRISSKGCLCSVNTRQLDLLFRLPFAVSLHNITPQGISPCFSLKGVVYL